MVDKIDIVREDENFQTIGVIIGHPDESPSLEEIAYMRTGNPENTEEVRENIEVLIEENLVEDSGDGYTMTDELEEILQERSLLVDQIHKFRHLYSRVEKPDDL